MTTEYRVRLDRGACDGVFACLVRDDRFVEAPDGLATVEGDGSDGTRTADAEDVELVGFADDRQEAAEQAARACPVDAIEVLTGDDDE